MIIEQLMDKIKRFPTLLGALIGLVIFASVMAIQTWFPHVGEGWRRNNANVRSVYFTIVFFVVWVFRLRSWQRRNPLLFWNALCVIFLLHSLGVFIYSVSVHPLLMKEWIILAAGESIVIVFGLDWLTRRFRRARGPFNSFPPPDLEDE